MFFPPGSEQSGHPAAEESCRSCGAHFDPAHRYCPYCGTARGALGRNCPDCGAVLGTGYRFCIRCGSDVSAVTGLEWQPAFSKYPVHFDVPYPDRLSRLSTFLRLPLAVPQLLVAYALGTVVGVVSIIAGIAILFTGRYPRGLFNLVVGFNRWTTNVYAYLALLRDEYPPFSSSPGRYPVIYEVDYPDRLNRLLIFIKWWLLIMVHQFLISLLAVIGLLLLTFSWFAILITGHYPRTCFNFNSGLMRWYLRVGAYTALLRDEFPPYSMRADAPAGGRTAVVVAALLGVVGWSLYIGTIVVFSSISPHTETVTVRYADVLVGRQTAPVTVDGTEVILLVGADPADPADAPRAPEEGYRYVSFDLSIVNRNSSLTSIYPETFRLIDNSGKSYSAQTVRRAIYSPDSIVRRLERVRVRVFFEVRTGARVLSLTYSPGLAAFVPFGERVRYEFH